MCLRLGFNTLFVLVQFWRELAQRSFICTGVERLTNGLGSVKATRHWAILLSHQLGAHMFPQLMMNPHPIQLCVMSCKKQINFLLYEVRVMNSPTWWSAVWCYG